jgi:hypothetical protein
VALFLIPGCHSSYCYTYISLLLGGRLNCHLYILPAYENGTGLFTCHRSASGARSSQVTSRPFR